MSLLSIVLPAYNEEQNIANTAKVLGELLEQHGIDYELVFISDGSKDGTFERIKEESAKNPRVRGAEFSRNFGKEAGIFAGLELTTGDAVIVTVSYTHLDVYKRQGTGCAVSHSIQK